MGRARTMTLRVRCSATTVMRGCCGTMVAGWLGLAAGTVTGGTTTAHLGDQVTLHQTPNSGYSFIFWTDPALSCTGTGDCVVTVTGNKSVLRREHFLAMKDGAIVANSGHFNVEIDIPALERMSSGKRTVRGFVEEYRLAGGKRVYLLGEGRLINLAAAEGHPASVMDMSFANQALCAEYMVKNASSLAKKVYSVPENIDKEIARLKLAATALACAMLAFGFVWQRGSLLLPEVSSPSPAGVAVRARRPENDSTGQQQLDTLRLNQFPPIFETVVGVKRKRKRPYPDMDGTTGNDKRCTVDVPRIHHGGVSHQRFNVVARGVLQLVSPPGLRVLDPLAPCEAVLRFERGATALADIGLPPHRHARPNPGDLDECDEQDKQRTGDNSGPRGGSHRHYLKQGRPS